MNEDLDDPARKDSVLMTRLPVRVKHYGGFKSSIEEGVRHAEPHTHIL